MRSSPFNRRGFGAARFNGFGGKVESGETAVQGAIRELEEVGAQIDRTPTITHHTPSHHQTHPITHTVIHTITHTHTPLHTHHHTHKEACIIATEVELRGRLYFEFVDDEMLLDVHVFEATAWSGEPAETDEVGGRV